MRVVLAAVALLFAVAACQTESRSDLSVAQDDEEASPLDEVVRFDFDEDDIPYINVLEKEGFTDITTPKVAKGMRERLNYGPANGSSRSPDGVRIKITGIALWLIQDDPEHAGRYGVAIYTDSDKPRAETIVMKSSYSAEELLETSSENPLRLHHNFNPVEHDDPIAGLHTLQPSLRATCYLEMVNGVPVLNLKSATFKMAINRAVGSYAREGDLNKSFRISQTN